MTPVKFWDAIRKLLPNKTSATLIKLRNKTTNLLIPPEGCAEYINSFFPTIGEKLAKALPPANINQGNGHLPYGTPGVNINLL